MSASNIVDAENVIKKMRSERKAIYDNSDIIVDDNEKVWAIIPPKILKTKVVQDAFNAEPELFMELTKMMYIVGQKPWPIKKYQDFFLDDIKRFERRIENKDDFEKEGYSFASYDPATYVFDYVLAIYELYENDKPKDKSEDSFSIRELVTPFNEYSQKVYEAIIRRDKLREELKKVNSFEEEWEAHHLIPVEVLKRSKVVQAAVDAGFPFNSVQNGFAAPKNHGPHLDINEEMVLYFEKWAEANPNFTPEMAKDIVLTEMERQRVNWRNRMQNNI